MLRGCLVETIPEEERKTNNLRLAQSLESWEEATDALHDLVRHVNIRMPRAPNQTKYLLMAQRIALAIRGLAFTEKKARDIPPRTLERIDFGWTATKGFLSCDPLNAAYFQSQVLWLSLKAGEKTRLGRALVTEAGFHSIGGSRSEKKVKKLLKMADELLEDVADPYLTYYIAGSQVLTLFLQGHHRQVLEKAAFAERHMGRHRSGIAWEQGTIRLYIFNALLYLGRLKRLADEVPPALEEARERGDRYLETNLRTRIIPFLRMIQDDPISARDETTTAISQWSAPGFSVQHIWDLCSQVELDLYEQAPESGLERLENKALGDCDLRCPLDFV